MHPILSLANTRASALRASALPCRALPVPLHCRASALHLCSCLCTPCKTAAFFKLHAAFASHAVCTHLCSSERKCCLPSPCTSLVAHSSSQAVRTEVYGSEAIKEEGGSWSIDRVKEIVKEGGNVSEMVEEVVLRNLFRKELEKKVTDGERPSRVQYQSLYDSCDLHRRRSQMVSSLVGVRYQNLYDTRDLQHRKELR